LRELQREVVTRGVVATISGTTLWRWLDADAIRPWRYRSWLFPRDPDFAMKAGPILDLYADVWQDAPLAADDYVLSADEKTSIQARRHRHAPVPSGPDRVAKIEHEYERMGAWAYLAAWDVRRAKLFGRCEPTTGIAPFDRLVAQVMAEEPYRSARRVFWVLDNGSGHRGPKAVERLQRQWPTLIPVFTPEQRFGRRHTAATPYARALGLDALPHPRGDWHPARDRQRLLEGCGHSGAWPRPAERIKTKTGNFRGGVH